MMAARLFAVVVALLVAGPLSAQEDGMPIRNYHVVNERLGTGGTPGSGAMAELATEGYELVVDLREDFDTNQARDALANGLSYVHVPVSWRSPDSSELEAFLLIMEGNPEKKILVHCAANYRASALVYLYEVIALGADQSVAYEHVEAIWEPNETWRRFMDQSLENAALQ